MSSTVSASLQTHRRWWSPSRLWMTVVAAVFILSWQVAGGDLRAIFSFQAAADTWRFVSGLFPPDLSPAFLRTVLNATLQTIATAIAASILSIVIGTPLAVLASANLWQRGILVEAERASAVSAMLSGVSRFVRALSGTLALAVAYSGLIGQVFSDLFDAADLQPLEALQSTGATRLQIVLRGLIPQTLASLTAYALYSFECCVRAASVLGLVGAGGIGYEVSISMRLFEYGQVLTLVLAFIVLMAATDAISRFVRGRTTRRLTGHSDNQADPSAASKLFVPLAVFTGAALSFYAAGFTPGVLEQQNLIQHAARFISGMWPPDVSGAFIGKMAYLVLQTIAISVIGSFIGIVLRSLFAVPATAGIMFLDKDATGHHSVNERSLRFSLYWAARLVLN